MESTKQKTSYCIGLETGRRLKAQFGEMDLKCLENGFVDAIKDIAPKLAQEEIVSLLTTLQKQIELQQKTHFTKLSEENKRASAEFLEANKQNKDIQTLSSGLQYQILSSGPKKSAHPTPLDVVTIHYKGSFIDGTVFDSSYLREEPLTIPLARAIPGWSEVLQLMQEGDNWKVFIPPYLAYAEMGFPPTIGPNMVLVFDIELIKIGEKPA
ncbi:MAG: outer membrane protein precursor [Chlamydiota bacterium]|jgi:FKBP-type peptidyl-prolyl cis-trans isomerase